MFHASFPTGFCLLNSDSFFREKALLLMGKVIDFREKGASPPPNLIASKPWEFRWSDWDSRHFIQMLRSESVRLEDHRKKIFQAGGYGVWRLPPHFVLRGGMAYTIQALFASRANEEKMREVYYLAGLMDCMINRVNPLLRTDLIRDMYKKVATLKSILNTDWYGSVDQILFPLDPRLYNPSEYVECLSKAETMKDLYAVIRDGTDEMFDILSLEYVFYTPGRERAG